MSLTTLLAKPTDIAKLKEFDLSTRPEKINPHILSAQHTDVAPLLGERLYNDIVKTPANYDDLLNGGYYTYQGIDYYNSGLKYVISLFAHARFTYLGSATYTPFGIVQKINQNASEEVSVATKKSLYTEAVKEANALWEGVRLFLIRTNNPLYQENCGSPTEYTGGSRFTLITNKG